MASKKRMPDMELEKPAMKYEKDQILMAKRYADHRDLINVLLSDQREYTLEDVDDMIRGFQEREVK